MAVRAGWVVAVARASAAAWQRVACNPETLPADRVLALLCCGPFHLLARLAAFLCVPFLPSSASLRLPSLRRQRHHHSHHLLLTPPELVLPLYSPSPSSSSSSSSSDEDDNEYGDIEDGDHIHPHVD